MQHGVTARGIRQIICFTFYIPTLASVQKQAECQVWHVGWGWPTLDLHKWQFVWFVQAYILYIMYCVLCYIFLNIFNIKYSIK